MKESRLTQHNFEVKGLAEPISLLVEVSGYQRGDPRNINDPTNPVFFEVVDATARINGEEVTIDDPVIIDELTKKVDDPW